MTIHYYLVDVAGDGDMYILGVCGENKDDILLYLESQYRDVSYLDSKEKPKKHKKYASKVLPCGTIVTCKFYCDRYQSLVRSKKILKQDRRHHLWE